MRNLIPHFVSRQFKQGMHSGSFQAATLFVDISGFTPLTETLMQYRKDGAEVLGEALEAIFVPLVSQVHARGGLIPLFAGDAFTALYPHDPADTADAPLHALQTAFFIQGFFAPGGADRVFPTKYGDFAIGAKVGLSYGPVQWGIPGQEGRFSFYFRGPAVDGCAQAEQQAVKGQIVADDRILPHIQGHVVTQPIGGGRYCQLTACSLDLRAPGVTLPTFSRADLSPFLPDAVLDLTAKAEFREVCPVFLSFHEPPEETVLHQFLAEAIRLADAYGGTFSQIDFGDMGGIVVLWFGAPVTHENDVQRAAEFLLACRRQGWPVPWRAGLAFGTVWAGIRGGLDRCEYGLIGDVVNLACRLALKAGWGELWVGPAAQERLQEAFRLEGRGTYQLKGKRGKIPVYLLQGKEEQFEAVFHPGQMVGREAELDQLAVDVQPILAGQFAGLVYVYGEAGIGKSRLVYELRRRLTELGVRWFLCPADQILRQSLNPFRRFLLNYFDQSRDCPAEQNRARFDDLLDGLIASLQALPSPTGRDASELVGELHRTRSFLAALVDLRWEGSLYEQLDPKLRFENTLLAVKTLVLAESLRQPVVMQLEDLQWLDADSQELVKLLPRGVQDYPLALVCTGRYRDDGSRVSLPVDADVPQQVLELDRLLPDGVRALAVQMLAPGEAERPEAELSEELAAFVEEKTGGNPFFVEQLLLDLRERGAVIRGMGGEWELVGEEVAEVPTTIGAVLIARLDRLVAQIKAVVQAAAVLGREFEVQVLSLMLRGEEGVPARVRRAEEERIWTALSEVRYLFRHALLRDAAYDMQLRARLRELHRLAGKAIAQVYAPDLAPYYPDLAYHYGRAEEVEGERRYARLAGEHAADQFANVEAVRYLSRALELTPEDDQPGRYSLLLAREKVHDVRGEREAQIQDLQALMALAEASNEDRLRAEAALRQAHYAHVTSDWRAAITAAQRGVTLAQASGDAQSEALGYLQWGQSLTMQGDLAGARAKIEQSLALSRRGGLDAAEAKGLQSLGSVHWHLGDLAEAGACFEGALRIFREVGDRRAEGAAVGNLGLICRYSDLTQAVHYLKQALTISRLTGDRKGQGTDLLNLGSVYSLQGEYSKSGPCYEQALAISRVIEDRWGEANALTGLGGVCLRVRDHAAAEIYFEQALQIYRDVGERYNEGQALGRLGVLYQEWGYFAKARHCLEACLDLGRQIGNRPGEGVALLNLGIVWRCLGDYAQAGLYLEESLDLCRQIGAKQIESACLAELGTLSHLLGDDQAAQTYSQQALTIAREVGEQPIQGHALTNLGRARMVSGHLAESAQAYGQALDLRRELGLHHLAAESQAGLAGVYLAQGELRQAQDQVEEILAYLETDTLDGAEEPFQVYLTCYRVLAVGQDPRAQELLAIAYTLLQARADAIEEADLRWSYLENVPHHREIVAAYEAT